MLQGRNSSIADDILARGHSLPLPFWLARFASRALLPLNGTFQNSRVIRVRNSGRCDTSVAYWCVRGCLIPRGLCRARVQLVVGTNTKTWGVCIIIIGGRWGRLKIFVLCVERQGSCCRQQQFGRGMVCMSASSFSFANMSVHALDTISFYHTTYCSVRSKHCKAQSSQCSTASTDACHYRLTRTPTSLTPTAQNNPGSDPN